MRYLPPAPLLPAAICLAVGSLLQHSAPWTGYEIWCVFTAVCLTGILTFWSCPIRRTISVALLLTSLGAINASFSWRFGHNPPVSSLNRVENSTGRTVTLEGRVASPVSHKHGRIAFDLGEICLQSSSSCIPVSGKLHVTLAPGEHEVEEGDGVLLRGIVKRPGERRNPADFDVGAWLASNELSGVLNRADLLKHSPATGVYFGIIRAIRRAIREAIRQSVPQASQGLPQALLLGDRSDLSAATRDDFARSGLMHLLAISGLHVLFVGMMLHRLLRPILMRAGRSWQTVELVRSTSTLALLMVYAVVSGASPSVVRAVIMTGFFLIGTVSRRVPNPLNAIGGAAFVILILDPSALFQAGFQLSFAAVLGLLLSGRGLDADLTEKFRSPVLRHLVSGALASVIATLATAPILMHQFGYVGLSGIALNLAAIPVAAWLLCSSILVVLTAHVSPLVSLPFGSAVDLLSTLLEFLAHIGSSLEVSVVSTTYFTAFTFSCLTLLTAILFPRKGTFRRWMLIGALIPPIWAFTQALVHGRFAPMLEVVFLDVGHGDAAIVRLPDDRTVVIDTGNRHQFGDEGERTVLPQLEAMDAKNIALTIISHPHSDHLGGLLSILKNKPSVCVADNGQFVDTEMFTETLNYIETRQVCHKSLSAGDTLDLGPLVRVLVLAPPRFTATNDANDRSVVLKFIFGKTSILFTGDIEREAEHFLATRYCELLDSDVIKVPHHGSRTSSTSDFVSCAARKDGKSRAVMSVGDPDKYGLPDEEIVQRWNETAQSLHVTFDHGALWLQSDGSDIREVNWR